MFRNARLKLAVAYTLGLALIMGAFSIALYLALMASLSNGLEQELHLANIGSVAGQVKQTVLADQSDRIRLTLLAVNAAGWVLAGVLAYLLAGRALRPLQRAIEREGLFAAHASHELRTPLTIMKGEVGVALRRERAASEYRAALQSVGTEVNQMEKTLDDLLALAQAEVGQAELHQQEREVATVVREVIEPLRPQLADAGVALATCIPSALRANLDWPRVRHLIRNLIDNAVRHTKAGGEIRIEAEQQGDELQIAVFNTSAPIEAGDLPHLFVPFYRGKGAERQPGKGLGLALCDWIARAHGGSITVQNVSEGVRFAVRLPGAMNKVS